MAIDTQALAGQINAIYESTLGRPADMEGLMYFANAIMSGGGSLADVQQAIASSPEAQGLQTGREGQTGQTGSGTATTGGGGLLSGANTDFTQYTGQLNSIYQKVFGRDADPTGLSYYGNLLAQGTSPADIEASLRGSAEFQAPPAQQFQRGIQTVPFGSQVIDGRVQQMAQYAQPAAQAGPAMGAPSLQGFLASNPAAAAMTPFQQSLQYQAALPSMIQPFDPASIPSTFQQTLSPGMRLDISQTEIPSWLQASINAQKAKDGTEVSDADRFKAANSVITNSGLTPGTTGTVTPGTTGGLLASNQISPQIISGYTDYLGRSPANIDLQGASYFQNLLNQGASIADIYAGIAGSAEGLLYAPTRAAKLAAAAAPDTSYQDSEF